MARVTYLYHSGFMVETKNTCLVFDYYTDGGKINNIDINRFKDKMFSYLYHIFIKTIMIRKFSNGKA